MLPLNIFSSQDHHPRSNVLFQCRTSLHPSRLSRIWVCHSAPPYFVFLGQASPCIWQYTCTTKQGNQPCRLKAASRTACSTEQGKRPSTMSFFSCRQQWYLHKTRQASIYNVTLQLLIVVVPTQNKANIYPQCHSSASDNSGTYTKQGKHLSTMSFFSF